MAFFGTAPQWLQDATQTIQSNQGAFGALSALAGPGTAGQALQRYGQAHRQGLLLDQRQEQLEYQRARQEEEDRIKELERQRDEETRTAMGNYFTSSLPKDSVGPAPTGASGLPPIPGLGRVQDNLTPRQRQIAGSAPLRQAAGAEMFKQDVVGGQKKTDKIIEFEYGQENPSFNTGNPERFKDETVLRKEFQGVTKDYRVVRDSMSRIEQSAVDPSPAGDIALITNYMKVLDPGSTVRESEFETAEYAASVPDQLRGQYEKLLSGKRLEPSVRADFVNRARLMTQARSKQYKKTENAFKGISIRYGHNPENIVLDYTPPETGMSGPQYGDVENGYIFIGQQGADPKDPNNWAQR